MLNMFWFIFVVSNRVGGFSVLVEAAASDGDTKVQQLGGARRRWRVGLMSDSHEETKDEETAVRCAIRRCPMHDDWREALLKRLSARRLRHLVPPRSKALLAVPTKLQA